MLYGVCLVPECGGMISTGCALGPALDIIPGIVPTVAARCPPVGIARSLAIAIALCCCAELRLREWQVAIALAATAPRRGVACARDIRIAIAHSSGSALVEASDELVGHALIEH